MLNSNNQHLDDKINSLITFAKLSNIQHEITYESEQGYISFTNRTMHIEIRIQFNTPTPIFRILVCLILTRIDGEEWKILKKIQCNNLLPKSIDNAFTKLNPYITKL